MIRFVLHKLLNKKWMTLSLLLGNILLLSLAVATPVYTDASLQRTLDLKFNEIIRENNEMPLRLRVQSPAVRGSEDINGSIRKMSERIALTGDDLRLPVQLVRTYFYLPSYEGTSDFPRKESRTKLQLASLSDLPAHVTIRGDEALFGERNADGSVNAYLPEQSLQKTRLTYGEILSFEDLKTPDGEALKVRIAGSFTMKDTEDPYWIDSPASASYRSRLFIDEGLFSSLFLEGRNDTRVSAVWNVLYDHTGFDAGEMERTLEVSRTLAKYIQNEYRFSASFNFSAWFSDFIHMEKQIRTTYLVLQIPVFALLVLFIFMVAGRIVDNEEAEIAVLNSRGVSKAQILMIYLVEGLILVLFAGAAAFFLSLPLVRLLLSSNGFLEFIIRKDLKLSLSARSFIYAGAAALAAVPERRAELQRALLAQQLHDIFHRVLPVLVADTQDQRLALAAYDAEVDVAEMLREGEQNALRGQYILQPLAEGIVEGHHVEILEVGDIIGLVVVDQIIALDAFAQIALFVPMLDGVGAELVFVASEIVLGLAVPGVGHGAGIALENQRQGDLLFFDPLFEIHLSLILC